MPMHDQPANAVTHLMPPFMTRVSATRGRARTIAENGEQGKRSGQTQRRYRSIGHAGDREPAHDDRRGRDEEVHQADAD